MATRRQGRSRFAVTVIGAVVASLVLLAVLLATTATPQEARAERAAPVLPVPTMEAEASGSDGVVAVPHGAIVTDGAGRAFVTVHRDGRAIRVDVHQRGTTDEGRVLVRGEGLKAGDQVELVALADADLPSP